MPPLLRQVYWAAFSNPCCGVYQPFYLHGVGVPAHLAVGDSTYAADSPWWLATRVKLACDFNYSELHPRVRETFDATEKWEIERQRQYESKVIALVQQEQDDAAGQMLRQFVDENVARIDREWKNLNESLPVMLNEVGVNYLFGDYLREWIRAKKVPLPVPK